MSFFPAAQDQPRARLHSIGFIKGVLEFWDRTNEEAKGRTWKEPGPWWPPNLAPQAPKNQPGPERLGLKQTQTQWRMWSLQV